MKLTQFDSMTANLFKSVVSGSPVDRLPALGDNSLLPAAEKAFSPDYFRAREKFYLAAEQAGAKLISYPFKAGGQESLDLTMDFALLQKGTPERVLFYLAATHGVEGYPGSAIEIDLLERGIDLPNNTAVALGHGMNSYGMAFDHRTNGNNVDLNRNCRFKRHPFDEFMNDEFKKYNDTFHPTNVLDLNQVLKDLTCGDQNSIDEFSRKSLTIFPGQNSLKEGLFYTGNELEESYQLLTRFIAEQLPESVRDVFIVDIHTGLGSYGRELLFSTSEALLSDKSNLYEKLDGLNGIQIIPPDPSSENFYQANGDTVQGAMEYFRSRGIVCNGICQEFGTYPFPVVAAALITENFYRFHRDKRPDWVRENLKEVFNPDCDQWRKSIIYMGRRLFDGLSETFLKGNQST